MAKSSSIFGRIARNLFWVLVTLITLLVYVVEIRQFFFTLLGVYCVGLMDGFVLTILSLVVVFYVVSKGT